MAAYDQQEALGTSLAEPTRNAFAEPSLNLWFAVLYEAIIDITNPKSKSKDRVSAWEWVNDTKNLDCFNSFDNICLTLGYDPNRIRGRLKKATIGFK